RVDRIVATYKIHGGRSLLSINVSLRKGIERSTSVGLFLIRCSMRCNPLCLGTPRQRVVAQQARELCQRRLGSMTPAANHRSAIVGNQRYGRATGGGPKAMTRLRSACFPSGGTSLSLRWSRSGLQLHTPCSRTQSLRNCDLYLVGAVTGVRLADLVGE